MALGFERNLKMHSRFSDLEYAAKTRVTRHDWFLREIDAVTPWSAPVTKIEPFHPRGDGRGRPPIGVGSMLHMYLAQQCFGLSDEGMEGAIYDSQAIRGFIGIDLSREAAPDATTRPKFRRLVEENKLTERNFTAIDQLLAAKGFRLRACTVVDATIDAASPSTKNQDGTRDPEMHQTKKSNQWHFGMKAHIGVDADSGLTPTVVTTEANVSDVTQADAFLHGGESVTFGDAGYQGVAKRDENQNSAVKWHVRRRPGKHRSLPKTNTGSLLELFEKFKAGVRAKLDHPFHGIKNIFGHKKARYRGLAKYATLLLTLFGLASLLSAKGRFFELYPQVAS
jgi:IS5 family transposase